VDTFRWIKFHLPDICPIFLNVEIILKVDGIGVSVDCSVDQDIISIESDSASDGFSDVIYVYMRNRSSANTEP